MSTSSQPKVMNNQEDDACLGALLLGNNIVFTMMFKAAIDLKVFDIIAREGSRAHVSASYIASQLPTQDPEAASRLDRLLRLFVSHSVLTCSMQTLEDGKVERLYGLTPASRFFTGGEDSFASMVAFCTHRYSIDVWLQFKNAILEGGDQYKKVHGVSIYECMDKDLTFNNVFNQTMVGFTTFVMNKVLEIYKGFEGLQSLVDVGGGTGKCLNMVISKYPSIKGINFDLLHVIQTAPSYPGIEHVGGDMFSFIPKGDAIMMKDILHNWDDQHCIKVLKNCYQVLPSKGKVIVVGMKMLEVPEPTMVSQLASRGDNMMLFCPGGKERTEKEYETLCKGSGFSEFKVVCLAFSLWGVMEFIK